MLETYGGHHSFIFTLLIHHAQQLNQSFLFNNGDKYTIDFHGKTNNTVYLYVSLCPGCFFTHAFSLIYYISHLCMRESTMEQ